MPTSSTTLFAAMLVGAGAVGGCEPKTASSSSSAITGAGAGGSDQGSGAGGGGGAGAASGGAGSGGAAGGGGGTVESCGIGSPGGVGAGVGGAGGAELAGPVRVVAANLSSGTKQSYDLGHGVRILQGLDADVVLLQEMNIGNNSAAALGGLSEDICEGECHYTRGPQAQIPNGVVSRLPILECGSWLDPEVENRNFVWARIDVPGEADLWAISVHLLTTSVSARQAEATALMAHIDATIPPADLMVLGGDLNTGHRAEAAITTLAALFDTAGPYPADHDGNAMTNEPRTEPYDWVLADAELSPFEIPVSIGLSVFAAGAVIDTRVYTPLSEIAPAQLGDSGAPGMQHMAVVKDFSIEP